MQSLTIAGNVGKDAVLRTTGSGENVLNFSIAVDNGKDANGNKRDSTWFDCAVWGKRASALESYITKGSKLVVRGRPTARAHEGKVYLGVNVDDLTFMGGGQERDDQPRNAAQSEPAQYGASGARHDYMDDDLPF